MSKVMDVVSDDVRAHRAEETVAFFFKFGRLVEYNRKRARLT